MNALQYYVYICLAIYIALAPHTAKSLVYSICIVCYYMLVMRGCELAVRDGELDLRGSVRLRGQSHAALSGRKTQAEKPRRTVPDDAASCTSRTPCTCPPRAPPAARRAVAHVHDAARV